MRRELIANLVTFTIVLAVGISTLVIGYMGLRPGTEFTRVTLQLPRSSQLVTGSSVLLRGVRIGEVERVDLAPAGAAVRLKYPRVNRIPADARVSIEQLSALGEPYVEISPTGSDGPYLADGAVVDPKHVKVPTSIPDLFRSLAAVGKIADAGPLAEIVSTMWQATNGADRVMPRLTQAGELLTVTIVSRLPQIRRMFADTQTYSADLAWVGPAISQFGPSFHSTIAVIRPAIDKVLELVTTLAMPTPLTDVLHPFMAKVQPSLTALTPKVSEVLSPALAIVKAINTTVPAIDFSAFLGSALAMFDNDGTARLQITVPVPGTPMSAPPTPTASPTHPSAPTTSRIPPVRPSTPTPTPTPR
ncbi:MlaD family protein [Tsukamurella tyrosinosolvens]|uniref:MlaD family protein n=1 Tax=Tsukamurella tyrosinosolvens TaxID=57704 RepID=UPI003F4A702C